MKHLTDSEIIRYLEGRTESSRGEDVTEHLVSCGECEKRVLFYHEIEKTLGSGAVGEPELVRSAGCLSDEDLALYMDEQSGAPFRDRFRDHVQTCDACFERIAFAGRSMRETVPMGKEPVPTPAFLREQAVERLCGKGAVSKKERALGKWADRLGDMTDRLFAPFRSPVPAYALAAAMVALLIVNVTLRSGGLKNLEPNPQFNLYQSRDVGGEGFSFGDSVKEVGIMPAQMAVVTGKDGRVQFQWNPLNDVDSYKITLIKRSASGDEKVLEKEIPAPEFSVSEDFFDKRVPYRWTVSGRLKDGTRFVGASQFIFINN